MSSLFDQIECSPATATADLEGSPDNVIDGDLARRLEHEQTVRRLFGIFSAFTPEERPSPQEVQHLLSQLEVSEPPISTALEETYYPTHYIYAEWMFTPSERKTAEEYLFKIINDSHHQSGRSIRTTTIFLFVEFITPLFENAFNEWRAHHADSTYPLASFFTPENMLPIFEAAASDDSVYQSLLDCLLGKKYPIANWLHLDKKTLVQLIEEYSLLAAHFLTPICLHPDPSVRARALSVVDACIPDLWTRARVLHLASTFETNPASQNTEHLALNQAAANDAITAVTRYAAKKSKDPSSMTPESMVILERLAPHVIKLYGWVTQHHNSENARQQRFGYEHERVLVPTLLNHIGPAVVAGYESFACQHPDDRFDDLTSFIEACHQNPDLAFHLNRWIVHALHQSLDHIRDTIVAPVSPVGYTLADHTRQRALGAVLAPYLADVALDYTIDTILCAAGWHIPCADPPPLFLEMYRNINWNLVQKDDYLTPWEQLPPERQVELYLQFGGWQTLSTLERCVRHPGELKAACRAIFDNGDRLLSPLTTRARHLWALTYGWEKLRGQDEILPDSFQAWRPANKVILDDIAYKGADEKTFWSVVVARTASNTAHRQHGRRTNPGKDFDPYKAWLSSGLWLPNSPWLWLLRWEDGQVQTDFKLSPRSPSPPEPGQLS